MNLDEIKAAIGNPSGSPHQPEGGNDVTPLTGHSLAKTAAEPSPANVEAQQGAGSTGGGLTPGAQGSAGDGRVNQGMEDGYSSLDGPAQLPVSPGLAALTAGGNFGANRPSPDGSDPTAAAVGRADHMLGRDQGNGQGINPMMKPANAPRQDGPFGKPSS